MCNYLHFLFSFGAGTEAFSDTGIEKGIASPKLRLVNILSQDKGMHLVGT